MKRFSLLFLILLTIISLLSSSAAYALPAEGTNPANPATGTGSNPTSLQPETIDVQTEAEKLNKEIAALDEELEIAVESYNAVTVQLENINQQLGTVNFDLGQAEAELENRQEIYNNRISAIYRNGRESFLQVLLGTDDLVDLVQRLVFLARITAADTSLLEKLQVSQEDIDQARKDLETLKQQRIALQQELEIRKAIIQIKIDFRRELLANINEEVRLLLEQEQARRAAEAQALVEYAKSQLGVLNIDQSPGSVINTAFQYLGISYKWGGDDPVEGFDCSGLVMYVFTQHGVELPHYSRFQALMGEPVVGSLEPGDLVFFGDPVHHVGMYIGGDYFIEAPRTGDVVKISILSAKENFTGARRFPLKPKEEAVPSPENPDGQNQPPLDTAPAEPVPSEEPPLSMVTPQLRLLSIPVW